MPDETPPDQSLHLPSLVIKNFRGIDELTIPRLGRVTLLAGKNGVGKTTVLDAVRIYAARARTRVLFELLIGKDEVANSRDEIGGETIAPDWGALFWERRNSPDQTISIGPETSFDALEIRLVLLNNQNLAQLGLFQPGIFTDEEMVGLEIGFRGAQHTVPTASTQHMGRSRTRHRTPSVPPTPLETRELPLEVLCNTLGPDVPNNSTIEPYMNDVALTRHEERAVEALNLVANATAERVALLTSGSINTGRPSRRIMVKVKDADRPVPLRSLGDGAVRVFATALALAASSGGFLLIDEAENGIHHSIQAKFWKMVLQTAQRNNVQVLATTHSWDCVVGFAQATNELEDVDGVLVRLERPEDKLLAVTYSDRNLKAAAKYGIEVR